MTSKLRGSTNQLGERQTLDAQRPERLLALVGSQCPRDETGYPLPTVRLTFLATDILTTGATLVTAPPWTGKSWLSRQLANYLHYQQETDPEQSRFRYIVRSDLRDGNQQKQ